MGNGIVCVDRGGLVTHFAGRFTEACAIKKCGIFSEIEGHESGDNDFYNFVFKLVKNGMARLIPKYFIGISLLFLYLRESI